jgi:membrane-associated protease RseP (regulator of RpoE activity)
MSDPAFSSVEYLPRRVSYPPAAVWFKHLFWLLLTFITTTLTGSQFLSLEPQLELRLPVPHTYLESLWQLAMLPGLYFQILGSKIMLLLSDPSALWEGLSYSLPLLFILLCHETGHYVACRIYKVEATLPLFIPSPPMVALGTFGAFIRILSPLPSRKAVFDIGVAGPIAGFIALIPIAFIGLWQLTPAPEGAVSQYVFSDPLFMRLLGWMIGKDPVNSVSNPFYMAAWIGLLVTSLNLIPSGQLDGGHAFYAIFGKKLHGLMTKIAFVIMATLSVLGVVLYNSPVGILFAIILAVMIKIGHPEPYDYTPLDPKRKLIAALTLVIFALCFVPFPIQINLF